MPSAGRATLLAALALLGCGEPEKTAWVPVDGAALSAKPSVQLLESANADGPNAACVRGSPVLAVVPSRSGAVPPQTTVAYDVALTNGDSTACAPRVLLFSPDPAPAGFAVFVNPTFSISTPGDTSHIVASVTGTTDATPGSYHLGFSVIDLGNSEKVSGAFDYALAEATGCSVRPSRELLVSDLSVVEDPLRTLQSRATDDERIGAWTFGRLMERAARSSEDASDMIEALFATWREDQSINGFTVATRSAIAPALIDRWPRRADGRLDLTRAPLRLLAIVSRLDLRSLRKKTAGQGRFVFGVLDSIGQRSPFTIIVEYRLPVASLPDIVAWARGFHALGALPFPSEEYNARLQALTDAFTACGADPNGVNGSALSTIRTNEIALAAPWELRQFELRAVDGRFHPAPVENTPDLAMMGSDVLADFINRQSRALLAGRISVPLEYEGAPFLGGSALNELLFWDAPGILQPEARQKFSLNTCNGCHGSETDTEFTHVSPRNQGKVSTFSGFLMGIVVPDPVTGEPHTFNELGRRKADLEQLVCSRESERRSDLAEGTYGGH